MLQQFVLVKSYGHLSSLKRYLSAPAEELCDTEQTVTLEDTYIFNLDDWASAEPNGFWHTTRILDFVSSSLRQWNCFKKETASVHRRNDHCSQKDGLVINMNLHIIMCKCTVCTFEFLSWVTSVLAFWHILHWLWKNMAIFYLHSVYFPWSKLQTQQSKDLQWNRMFWLKDD